MANAKNTLYIAKLKPANEERFGFSILKGAVCIEDLKELLESEEVENLQYEYEGQHFINVKVIERKNPDKFGKTHFIAIDDFVPDSSKRKEAANDNSKAANDNEPKDTTEEKKTVTKSTTRKTGKRGSKKQAATA